METSSPLASLQPNHPGQFPRPSSSFFGSCNHEPASFNFKDMTMFQPRPDYFSFNPARGSSPTASLAADLSQNFHIDQSPQLPTPRRNLFSGPASGSGRPRDLITPPIPSSSPGPDVSMEVSPLPHKPLSCGLTSSMDLGVPTPGPTPLEYNPMAPPPVPKIDLLNIPRPHSARPALGHARRISSGTRPFLRKGHSMNAVASRASGTKQSLDPPFVFGPGSGTNVPPPILESFADSPPSERKLPSSNSTSCLVAGPPLPKLVFPENNSQNGSPVGPLRRMSATRVGGARVGLGRRTQSLQYNAIRPMRQEKRCCTEGNWQPSIELHETRALKLPHFKPEEEVDALPRITRETLIDVMNGAHASEAGNVTVIDCRFEYEYEGGHIGGAVNFNDKETLASKLFSGSQSIPQPNQPDQRPQTLIFHCEYSNHRAPIMAKFIRQRDRFMNSHRYPHLTYPEMYILDGGYSSFFKEHRHLCEPQSYVEMDSKEHEDACERGMAKVKRRAKLSRAQTFAFGQSTSAGGSSGLTVTAPGIPSVPSVPELATLNASVLCKSPTGFDDMDVDMDYDSPAPPPRPARRNDSY